MNAEMIVKLQKSCPTVEIRVQEPMSRHVSFRIGGPAAVMAFPRTEGELAQLLRFSRKEQLTPVILGAGTNVLPPDDGLDNLVICLMGGLQTLRCLEGSMLEVGAGVTMAKAAVFACEQGLSGLEFAHGIPGTVGGGIFMNAGAYGGEMSQIAVETTVMDFEGNLRQVTGAEQGFVYRSSAFQAMDAIIVRTTFRLESGDRAVIKEKMQELAQKRRNSQPLNLPSAGSTFKRPVGGYAAALIDEAGLKGLRVGGAAVSTKHAGFVVNDEGATCADVQELIAEIQARVLSHSGILLEPEVRML